MSDSDDDEEDYYQGKLVCPSCGESSLMRNVEEEEDDTTTEDGTLSAEQKLERFTHDTCMAMCLSCGAEVEPFDFPWVAKYNHYKVGVVRSVVVFKKRFQHLEIDVGQEELLKVVTNAKVKEEQRVVVACVGAVVPAGADIDEDESAIMVKKGSVQGKPSHGMLCDCPALGWVGSASIPAKISDIWPIGMIPPETKQRGGESKE
jgi:tRNA-binding EMAP/Myf-like protein